MFFVVFITCPTYEEGEKIARVLLEERLAACVNITSDIKSFFWWEGKIQEADEVLLIVKTKKSVLKDLIKKVKSIHSYSVPEIIALPITGGSKDFTKWIDEETR
ncbi:MAG: divalent-cation tolerance protein CutA [Candidatus Aenigmatarchaeota archaeon]